MFVSDKYTFLAFTLKLLNGSLSIHATLKPRLSILHKRSICFINIFTHRFFDVLKIV